MGMVLLWVAKYKESFNKKIIGRKAKEAEGAEEAKKICRDAIHRDSGVNHLAWLPHCPLPLNPIEFFLLTFTSLLDIGY